MTDAGGLDRRGFLRAGGLSFGLVALAAACVNEHESPQATQTGTRVPAPSTSVPPFPGTSEMDARMVLTALSVERLAVETYDAVLKESWISDATTVATAKKVQDNHRAHVAELAVQATALGQDAAAVKPNASVKEDTVDSEIEAVKEAANGVDKATEAAKILASMEDGLAQLYAKMTGTMTTPDLRRRVGSIGSATARQYTALAEPAGVPLVPLAFMPTSAAAIPEESWITPDTNRLPGGAGTTSTTRAAR